MLAVVCVVVVGVNVLCIHHKCTCEELLPSVTVVKDICRCDVVGRFTLRIWILKMWDSKNRTLFSK